MIKRVLATLAALILVILPFLVGVSIGGYTPYKEGNSFQTYVLIWAGVSIVLAAVLVLLVRKFHRSSDKVVVAGMFLFLMLCPIFGIVGLVAPPDLGTKMLEHPEREHFRYFLLFIAALLFTVFMTLLLGKNLLVLGNTTKWIVTTMSFIAFAEFMWEFSHHYLYPEALKEWTGQGKSVDDFVKSYDNFSVITFGVIGRYVQYGLIIWLSLKLFLSKQVRLWNPIVSLVLSLLGIVSATVVFQTKFNIPKGYEILLFFFIPGFPFLLLYWTGVALVTHSGKVKWSAE